MRARAVPLIVSVLFLATACGSLDEHVRRFKELYVAVVSSVPARRDTADGCVIDLAFTNPYAQRVRVILTYRAFDAEGRELHGLRVGSVVPAKQHMVLAGESTPGLACATIARFELHYFEVNARSCAGRRG
jgi:hypothetical protein